MLGYARKAAKSIEITLIVFLLAMCLYGIADSINKATGGYIVAGYGIHIIGGGGIDTARVNTTALLDSFVGAWDTDQTIAGIITFSQGIVLPDASIPDADLSANVSLLGQTISASEIADGDHGDFTYATNVATLDADVVGDNEIDYSAVTLDDFDYQTAWRIFYSNTDGDVTELAFGTSGQYLRSNGATSAPTWDTPGGAGDMLKSTYDVNEDGDIDLAAGGLAADVSAYTGLVAISGSAASEVDSKSELEAQIADVADFAEADGETYSNAHDFSSATISLPAGAVDAAAEITEDILTAALFADGDWGDVSVASNSVTLDADVIDSTNIPAGAISEADIEWRLKREFMGREPASGEGVDDSIRVLYPIKTGNYDWVELHWNSSAQNDQVDTVYFTKAISGSCSGLDTVAVDVKTTGTVTTDASVKLVVYKRSEMGGAKTDIDSTATFNTSGAFSHKVMTTFTTNADDYDFITLMCIITADSNDSVWVSLPTITWKGN